MAASALHSPSPRSEQLLDIALAVLERDGLDRLSVGEIARRAGIKTPSLYKHFASKADIELRLIEHGFGLFAEAVRNALAPLDGTASHRQRVTVFAGAYRGFGLQHPQLYRLMNDRPLPRDLLAPGTEEAATRDYFTIVDDEHSARSYWAWAHGLLSLEIANRYPPGADLDAAWAVLIDTVAG